MWHAFCVTQCLSWINVTVYVSAFKGPMGSGRINGQGEPRALNDNYHMTVIYVSHDQPKYCQRNFIGSVIKDDI